MTDQFSKYMSRSVPRYTSYPTAPHFSGAVAATDYDEWLAVLNPQEPISLYLHVPYCRELCWYCGCNMKLAKQDAPVAAYAKTLRAELRLLASKLPARMKVSHLHWGGGTPTALTPDDLEKTMDDVRDLFDVLPDAEIAIESDPRTITPEMVARIGTIGFTRASFGVQEFDPKVQLAINRIQPPKMVRECVADLRNTGVTGINFDLIYGLPHQTVASLLDTVRLCVDMHPDRIALFGYAHVPWMAKKQRLIDEAALPDAVARLEQAQLAGQALEAAGYVPIGLDHFARQEDDLAQAAAAGTLRRNFQGYTNDRAQTMLGVGTTSIGRTSSGYVQNITETGAWTRAIHQGELPIAKGLRFQGEDLLRGHVIEALMCLGVVDLAAVGAQFSAGDDWFVSHIPALDALQGDGLIERQGARINVTEQGLPLVRVIAAVFDSYFAQSQAKHAVAV